jgi:hypothetical protein
MEKFYRNQLIISIREIKEYIEENPSLKEILTEETLKKVNDFKERFSIYIKQRKEIERDYKKQ